MSVVRVSTVEYLNARPLVHGLEARSDLFDLRFHVPAKCATLLHDGSVDLGLIPSIEYLRQPNYHVVPDVAVASNGPVASVWPSTRMMGISGCSLRTSATLSRTA